MQHVTVQKGSAYVVGTLFTLFAVAWFILSPYWLRGRYHNHYERHIAGFVEEIQRKRTTGEQHA